MKCWSRALLFAVALAATGTSAASRAAEPRLNCLSPVETREALVDQKLVAPFRAMIEASRHGSGEAIAIKLCRSGALTVYDVLVLRHDGRVIHLLVDAANGSLIGPGPPP